METIADEWCREGRFKKGVMERGLYKMGGDEECSGNGITWDAE